MRTVFRMLVCCLVSVAAVDAGEKGIGALKSFAATLDGERREAADFLIEHLPERDRESLPLELFRENLEQAFIARGR